MSAFIRTLRTLRSFASDLRGSASIEAAYFMPVLAFWYVGSFGFFDAFRSFNASQKAAYTIADILSRQENAVNDAYLDGLDVFYDHLTYNRFDTSLRVSSVTYDPPNLRYVLTWAYASDGLTKLKQSELVGLEPRLPNLGLGESLIVVETSQPYEVPFGVMDNFIWKQFVPTRSRYTTYLPYDDGSGPIGIGDVNPDNQEGEDPPPAG